MLPPVFVTLKASSAVRAIVGTSPAKIYRHGHAPQGVEPPYITWQVVTATPENQLSGTPTTDRATIQVNCWYPEIGGDKGIEVLATAVRDAIEPFAHMTSMPIDQQEPETRFFWIALEFDWFNDRPS